MVLKITIHQTHLHINPHIQQLEGSDLAGDAEGQHHHGRHQLARDAAAPEHEPRHAEQVHVEVARGRHDGDQVADEGDTWRDIYLS